MKKLSSGAVKSILKCPSPVSQSLIDWTERWIAQFVRENSYPPQLISAEFICKLGEYLSPTLAIETLQRIRTDYAKAFPKELTEDEELINLTN